MLARSFTLCVWISAISGFALGSAIQAQQPGEGKLRDEIRQSQQKLKSIAAAILKMADKEFAKAVYPAGYSDQGGQLILSWRVAILPALGEKALFEQFRLDEPWDSEHNRKLIPAMPAVYKAVRGKTEDGHSYYRGFSGEQAMFPPRSPKVAKVQFGDRWCFPVSCRPLIRVADGTSNTLLIVEGGEAVPWTKPEEVSYDPRKPLPKVGGQFDGAFNAIICDGSTKFFPRTLPERVLRAAITPAGFEDVKLWEYGENVK
jgi:hypothetical protein